MSYSRVRDLVSCFHLVLFCKKHQNGLLLAPIHQLGEGLYDEAQNIFAGVENASNECLDALELLGVGHSLLRHLRFRFESWGVGGFEN